MLRHFTTVFRDMDGEYGLARMLFCDMQTFPSVRNLKELNHGDRAGQISHEW